MAQLTRESVGFVDTQGISFGTNRNEGRGIEVGKKADLMFLRTEGVQVASLLDPGAGHRYAGERR